MSNGATRNANLLIRELLNGQDLTRQLEARLSDSQAEFCKSILQGIESALHRAISLAKWSGDGEGADSPNSVGGNRNSDNSRRGTPYRREMSKKRKTLPRWEMQVKAMPGSSMDCPPEDGFSWRKYGQKDILQNKFPRGYYRCTYKKTHGCPAMKQVQRSDENPTAFNVIYKGEHACQQRANSAPAPATELGSLLFIDGGAGLTVTTQGLVGSPSISSPPTPMSRMGTEPRQVFSPPVSPLAHPFTSSFSPPFSSISGAGNIHFIGADSFNGANHGGAAESDRWEALSVDASAAAMDLGVFLTVDHDYSFLSHQ